ncbi:AtpZ/AtpI family protein [Oxynema sp. CENA135]|jgi:ATP synthase protein I|uniref:ATPase F0F1 n=1 Tax=Oxynema aestuarii AP17 TaxID=2064643 RepID=A0A6H1TRH3_9CYAN|nr:MULTISPECIES: AtpZ/AtpI family protein [Oxynema]MBK4730553.1 AtpZ/AtpI family protein [Oxynema sp. CENA135]QIZ69198.1 hypothetical protein HCG48_00180 [Oxynema aestuarii AP17]RMH77342.1 MAG: hypothetical protein D6680_05480 [Cyanobacteria bacterium J007]
MNHDRDRPEPWQEFRDTVDKKARRKLAARRDRYRSIWYGLGMYGLVGWSVVIPALLGIAAGIWIDTHFPSPYSWTLMGLFIGIVLGCLTAWYWIEKERQG